MSPVPSSSQALQSFSTQNEQLQYGVGGWAVATAAKLRRTRARVSRINFFTAAPFYSAGWALSLPLSVHEARGTGQRLLGSRNPGQETGRLSARDFLRRLNGD
jgi:hypothetical protein